MGQVTRRRTVLRIEGDRRRRRPDTVAVEEPLEIRLNGHPFAVTLRTPGDDIDLVHGFLHAEGVISSREDVVLARYCAGRNDEGENTYNVLDVSLAPHVAAPDPGLFRNVLTTSACGLCGTTSIDQVLRTGRFGPDRDLRVPAELVAAAPDRLRAQQPTFERTGGLHGAGLLRADGELLCVREDVGRHNAVDKVLGWALRQDLLPLRGTALVVSSRASFELTQKAVLAGIGMLIAVSAPSSLAIELAEAAALCLVGFVRHGAMNVYTRPEAIPEPAREPEPVPEPTAAH
ncbi:MAG: formate dehydrogenase accessory sulfurtransferase FdhD [Propionibacteriaceae bacterium]